MAPLRYTTNTSLDGFVNDARGSIEWSEPDAEVHGFINDLERPVGTYLYGRRLYDTMVVWETLGTGPDDGLSGDLTPEWRDYGRIWRAAEKVVYSRSGRTVQSARTRVLPRFDPDEVRAMKAAAHADLSVGGAELAGQALAAGLVDECHLLIRPVTLGGGTPALPRGVAASLTLVDERRFSSGVVHLHYRIA